ncbi:MAG: DUF452 family protein [Desulfobulbus sp.]|nr:DUF452 family protein [Desulfobulbus sp.]
MQTAWLHRHQRRECILFFCGWGMDPTPFREPPAADLDLCMFFDYRKLDPIDLKDFAGYQHVHLVAWSMGVWMASHLLAGRGAAFASSTAIGGTLLPVDQQRGIPPGIYNAMLDHFSSAVLDAFQRDMFDDPGQLARFLAHRPQRTLSGLRDEMAACRDAFLRSGPGDDIYSRALITSRDRIFSGRNQLRAWGKGRGDVTAWPHFPFYYLADWRDLLPPP